MYDYICLMSGLPQSSELTSFLTLNRLISRVASVHHVEHSLRTWHNLYSFYVTEKAIYQYSTTKRLVLCRQHARSTGDYQKSYSMSSTSSESSPSSQSSLADSISLSSSSSTSVSKSEVYFAHAVENVYSSPALRPSNPQIALSAQKPS